jgi:hypothetical protein
MTKQSIGLVVEGAGALSVLVGVVLSIHHLSISLCIGLGLAAIYVGRMVHAGAAVK